MVEITPVETEEVAKASENAADQAETQTEPEPKPSEERLLDAEAIEVAAKTIDRPTARAHLESLAQKLRRDAAALKRVEASRAKAEAASSDGGGEASAAAPVPAPAPSPAPAPAPAPASAPAAPPKPAVPAPPVPPVAASSLAKYSPIDRFSFDAGGYNSEKVTVYIPLPGVGGIPRDRVSCDFTPTSFDLIVRDLGGKDYRLVKDNLDKDIDPEKSKYVVKADKIVLKLGKCKSEYGSYDHWSDLTAKKPKKKASAKENPTESIMELMKNMYDEGDDNMKKMIGETMVKQREGKLGDGMGGMGDLGGMGDMGF